MCECNVSESCTRVVFTQAKDLVQVLLDAQDKINEDSAIAHNKIVGLAFDMLLGGFETSANTLSYITHLLATHPNVQKRLQEKIDKYFKTEPVRYV